MASFRSVFSFFFRCLCAGSLTATVAVAQSEPPAERWPLEPGIYFPQAPKPHTWRKSVGVLFTTTPPEITEEVRVSVPAFDIQLQRGLTRHLFLQTRLQTQFIQSHATVGLRYARPITERFFVGAGVDVSGWVGALQIKDVFDSQAYGFQNTPNISAGYKLTRDLRITAKVETIFDLYYRTEVGSLSVVNRRQRYNGVAFAFLLEQPFYHKQNVYVGFRAAYANFNWQLWSLYDTFDRNLLYPQILFGFIL